MAIPSVRLEFSSPILTPRDLSELTAARGLAAGWPRAFVTRTAKSPTVTVDFCALPVAANVPAIRAVLIARTTKDFLIIGLPSPSSGCRVGLLWIKPVVTNCLAKRC